MSSNKLHDTSSRHDKTIKAHFLAFISVFLIQKCQSSKRRTIITSEYFGFLVSAIRPGFAIFKAC
jgi:hypothetical protein